MSVPTEMQAVAEAWADVQERVSKLLPTLNKKQCEEILQYTVEQDLESLEFLVSHLERPSEASK